MIMTGGAWDRYKMMRERIGPVIRLINIVKWNLTIKLSVFKELIKKAFRQAMD